MALLPGGFQEATLFARNRHRVYINQRKGFIKYALRHGYVLAFWSGARHVRSKLTSPAQIHAAACVHIRRRADVLHHQCMRAATHGHKHVQDP